MKILRIQLTNLNSLRGEHTIDLESDPLGTAGIFAITGPTGAGKSTILDAVTLALYGRAARYGSSPNPEHMMSRHTGTCSASVTFGVPSGRYTAEWQLRRSRGKPGGNIQPARRYIYDASGTVLTEQILKCDSKIEELCGLDYDRFMRSALLAQGEFARFLKARANERAELLESLTGTTIYSELGALAHQELGRRRTDLEARRQQQGMVQLLSEGDRKIRESTIGSLVKEQAAAQEEFNRLASVVNHSDELQSQLQRETGIRAEQLLIAQRRQQSTDELLQLERHQLAIPFLTALSRADDADNILRQRTQAHEDAKTSFRQIRERQVMVVHSAVYMAEVLLAEKKKQLAEREQNVRKLERARQTVENWLTEHQADKQLSAAYPVIIVSLNELRNVRRELANLLQDSIDVHRQLSEENQRLQETLDALASAKKLLAGRTERHRTAELELKTLLADDDPRSLQAQLEQLRDRHRDIRELLSLEARCSTEKARVQTSIAKIVGLQHRVVAEQAELQKAVADEDRANQLVIAYRDHLTTAKMVASLEEHRSQLISGQPCPLCGAAEHPYVSGTDKPPKVQAIEKQIAQAEEDRKTVAAAVRTHRRMVTTTEAELSAEQRRKDEAEAEAIQLSGQIKSAASLLKLDRTTAADLQQALKSTEADVQSLNKRLEQVDIARQTVTEFREAMLSTGHKVTEAGQLEKLCRSEIQRRKDRIAILEDRIELSTTAMTKIELRVKEQLSPFDAPLPGDGKEEKTKTELDKRRREFDDRQVRLQQTETAIKDAVIQSQQSKEDVAHVDASLQRLKERRDAIEVLSPSARDRMETANAGWVSLESAEDHLNQLESDVAAARERVTERQTSVTHATAAVDHVRNELTTQLAASVFATPEALRSAILDDTRVKTLTAMKTSMDDEEKNLAGQLQSVRVSVDRLRKQETVEGVELENLKALKNVSEQALQELIGRIATTRDELRRDDENRKRLLENEESLRRETEAIKAWELLNSLIGSADGSRFRRFAQGISLDVLVRHANQHLSRLSDRYQLHRVEGQELDLAIIDLFQAGVSRPMMSLSGGESFLASLALALGLSDLAGRNVQINSLFIDEGFGSLDPETLDIALSALNVLRLSNKTIGVISHVALLKERITTQIAVSKLPGGVSELVVCS